MLGRLKSIGVIAPGPRAPEPGAPIAWVTTARFLEVFALGSLRDLPDLDALGAAGATALDDALGLIEADGAEDEAAAGSEDPGGGRPPGRRAPGIRIPTVRVDVTVALSTLMGLDELPGEVAGLGPVPAEQARALAAGGLWRRLVTDPLTGAVLDVGRRRYRPPAGLAEHVMARDGSCVAPGCCVPSHRCDLDHTTEFHGVPANGSPVPGTTSAARRAR